jgi:hypothetical protein
LRRRFAEYIGGPGLRQIRRLTYILRASIHICRRAAGQHQDSRQDDNVPHVIPPYQNQNEIVFGAPSALRHYRINSPATQPRNIGKPEI